MSWGRDPSKWGKQVAVRFREGELAQLDELVAEARESWEGRTRSKVIVRLVNAAHRALLQERQTRLEERRQTAELDAERQTPDVTSDGNAGAGRASDATPAASDATPAKRQTPRSRRQTRGPKGGKASAGISAKRKRASR